MSQLYSNPLNNMVISDNKINKSLEILNIIDKQEIKNSKINENQNKSEIKNQNENEKEKSLLEIFDKPLEDNNEMNLFCNINKEETQQLIKSWLDLDDEIEKLNLAIRERKKKQKKLNEIITKLMVLKNIPKFNTSTSDIILTEKKQKKTLSNGLLLNLSTHYFENNTSKAENFIKYIEENRGIVIKNNIKRKKKEIKPEV
jgi:hypothetical protein